MMYKYLAAAAALGAARNAVILSSRPLEKDELYIERLARFGCSVVATPFLLPFVVGSDLANLERKLRGLEPKKLFVPYF